ncbi:MAG TPA: hypothetical protein VIK25_08165 [Gemmatimonadaceae bacterium]
MLNRDSNSYPEQWLLARWPALLRADLLKVAHHGSASGSSEAFLDAVQPRAALVSVAARNFYGHPDPAVMRRLSTRAATVLRTDQLGTIVASTAGAGWTIRAGGVHWLMR